jgi:hypothetical protein
MNNKRLAIGAVVGTIVLYLLGMLFWEVLFADFFEANSGSASGVEREMPILWALIVGTLLYAVLLTLTLESAGASKSLAGGLKTGVVVGALLWGTADFTLYGLTNLSTLTGTIADTVLEGIRGGVAGAVIAIVLGKVGD